MHAYVHRYVPVFTFSISTYSLLHAAFDSPSEVFFWAFTKGTHPDSYCIFVLLLRHFVSMMSCDSVALFGTPAPLLRLFLEVPQ